MPTVSVENYLKAIFLLQEETGGRVRTKVLAERLGVALPSATNMLKSLAEAGLVEHAPYQGALLTPRGTSEASRVVRNHRLVEAFLVETLGYTWDEVHAEAERLEHAVSDELADRIDAFLGRPEFDPHGDPIPRADGQMARRSTGSLLDSPAGARVQVTRVLDQRAGVLRYLAELGVVPGAHFEVIELEPFDGPLIARCERGERRSLGRGLAARVHVRPVPLDV
jgi:DtxR family Mn-dependent transcriptional regulator